MRADRYDLAEARNLGQHGALNAHALKVRNVQRGTVAVPDPLGANVAAFDPKTKKLKAPPRLLATVNRRVDILEYELSHRRISADAYAEGRLAQGLYERAGLSVSSNWTGGSRIDAEVRKELAIIRRIGDARLISSMLDDLRALLGRFDAELIRQILAENRKYADVVMPARLVHSRIGAERGTAYVAQRFRDALETLARERRRSR